MAAAFRDSGMEVIYTGLRQTPEMIVEASIQEDVDVIALSILSGAHMTIFPAVLKLMEQKGLSDVLLTGGGIIPREEAESIGIDGSRPALSVQEPRLRYPSKYIREWVTTYRAD